MQAKDVSGIFRSRVLKGPRQQSTVRGGEPDTLQYVGTSVQVSYTVVLGASTNLCFYLE